MTDVPTILAVDDLYLAYGDNPILKGVSMTLARGEVVSLLGPSGSGKTTLLRAIAGLETPSRGTIVIAGKAAFDGANALDVPAEARNLGLVFQSYALWPHKTVFDNVAYGLRLRKTTGGELKERTQTVLDQLGLGQLGARFPHQLSGGQQQRVALARALVYNPPVILLDEPLSNLDAKLREEARAWLRELIVRLQLSAVCVTHDQGEAMAISDRILLLNQGRIEQQGTPTQMYSTPSTLFVADFMGNNNRLAGTIGEVQAGAAQLTGNGWSLTGKNLSGKKSGEPGEGLVRLERVRLADAPGPNRLSAETVTAMYLGDRWELLFRVGDTRLRTFADAPVGHASQWLEIAPDDLWIY